MTAAAASPSVCEIVITGGSCAGKTESLERLAAMLRHDGHHVITVPEVATMIINGGVADIGAIAREDGVAYCRFQREVFMTIQALRRSAVAMAATGRDGRGIVLYDRGELDGTAYHRHDCFAGHAAECGTTLEGIRDSYAAVMHLVTTADGAEDFYTKANNTARWDNADEARFFDAKIVRAWQGHREHVIIDNSTDYAGKLERLYQSTRRVVGDTAQLSIDLDGGGTALPQPLEFNLTGAVVPHTEPAPV